MFKVVSPEEAFRDGQKYQTLRDRVDEIFFEIDHAKDRAKEIRLFEKASLKILNELRAIQHKYPHLMSVGGKYPFESKYPIMKISACISEENYLAFKNWQQKERERIAIEG